MKLNASDRKPFLPWIASPAIRNVAIVGLCKNAGKTVLLNELLKQYPRIKWGVLSTGRDGESTDAVFRTPKPRVLLPEGTVFCADSPSLEAHGSAISLLAKTPWQRGGKKLFLAKALGGIATEIAGPGTAAAQNACAAMMHSYGAKKVLIDGSLDRKSIALSDAVDALLLVAGASFGKMEDIISELQRLLALSEIPATSSLSAHTRKRLLGSSTLMCRSKGRWKDTGITSLIGREKELTELLDKEKDTNELYIPGVYTGSQHHKLAHALLGRTLLFRHPDCIKLNLRDLLAFRDGYRPECLIPFKLKAIFINSLGVGTDSLDADIMRQTLRTTFPMHELLDLMEL